MNIQNLKKSKKGFTLVEIIVVLVIIAILAAIAIPAMTGWIDKANERTDYAEARTVLLAAQTVASEAYALDSTTNTAINKDDVAEIAGVDASDIGDNVVSGGAITALTYTGDKVTLKWTKADGWVKQ